MKYLFYSLRYKIAAALVNYLRPRLKPWLDASVDSMVDDFKHTRRTSRIGERRS